MFEKIGQAAEQAAGRLGVSRRGFFRRLARWSSCAALGVMGLLVTPGVANAYKGLCGGGGGIACTLRGKVVCYCCLSSPDFGTCRIICLNAYSRACRNF